MPKSKGTPKTGGRAVGTPNKATAAMRELAAVHGADAIELLAALMNDPAQSPQCRIAAATQLLDRGYGKPTQHTELNASAGVILRSLPASIHEFV